MPVKRFNKNWGDKRGNKSKSRNHGRYISDIKNTLLLMYTDEANFLVI